MNQFAKNLAFLLSKTSVTQAQLALHVNKRQTAVSSWKNGESEPSIENLLRISDFFGISVGDLIVSELTDVHLIEKTGKEKREENVHLNVHPNVHLTAPNPDIMLSRGHEASAAHSPPADELFWRDKYLALLEKTAIEGPNSAAASDRLEGALKVLHGMHHFLLELAAEAHSTGIEVEAMRLNNIIADQMKIQQQKGKKAETQKPHNAGSKDIKL